MTDEVKAGIERAKWLLNNLRFATMATVNEDGSPLNSPYFFMAGNDLSVLYWGSHPGSQHSKNILRTGQLFIVLYEESDPGGLYIECENGRVAEGEELTNALEVHNNRRARLGKDPLPLSYYNEPKEQRMWICNTKRFWINLADRYDNGRLREDTKQEIRREDLS